MLEWLAELKEEDRVNVIRQAFQNVLGTPDGLIMLSVMFEQLYFFRPCQNDEHRVLNNYAKFLLRYLGDDAQLRMLEALVPKRKLKIEGEKNGH